MKIILAVFATAIFSSLLGLLIGLYLVTNSFPSPAELIKGVSLADAVPYLAARHSLPDSIPPNLLLEAAPRKIPIDFVQSSRTSTRCVVFINVFQEHEYRTGTLLDWFFEPQKSHTITNGSGVIMTEDGYIVTNNHVIEKADHIEIAVEKRTFKAELVGADPSSDLAVLKIEAKGLTPIPIGSSQELRVGQWVLAVGNPFNLTSTVTAGIVSAKGRNINLLKENFPIESFIQTDAAINPGNSGGALVNQEGQLVGINTAILSRTGSYSGYGFAIPVDLVMKIYRDIVEYGEVQKAFSGASFVEIDGRLADELELEETSGVIVGSVEKKGGAGRAGIKEGDIIIGLDDREVDGLSTLDEYIALHYPGDTLRVLIRRDGKEVRKSLVLLNREGSTGLVRREILTSEFLGGEFEKLSLAELNLLRIRHGVRIHSIVRGGYFSRLNLPPGFIITSINGKDVESVKTLENLLRGLRGRIEIQGIDERVGHPVAYTFYLR